MIRILTIPFNPDKELFDESAVNDFLVNKKLKHMNTQFFPSLSASLSRRFCPRTGSRRLPVLSAGRYIPV